MRPFLIETRTAPTYYCLIEEMEDRLSYHGILIFIRFNPMALTLSQPRPRIGEH